MIDGEQYTTIATFHRQPFAIVDFGVAEKQRFGVARQPEGELLLRDASYHACLKHIVEDLLGRSVADMCRRSYRTGRAKPTEKEGG